MAKTVIGQYVNQLAQSFTVSEEDGIFVTKIGLYFAAVSATFPITLHIKPLQVQPVLLKLLLHLKSLFIWLLENMHSHSRVVI